ncbi:polyprenyl diphosphate synthase [Streptomyces sp. DT2A-34]|uniref:polyprenyl diphosphate synthase n=1 Tax=Streptomyces sp. DT2A-34 TaxID=3051182 RepID=UPI00265C3904|nr:polyprenyl diphosphate synthase [Streptomyces sp. DT2A-34]MDO0910973.1 polyprenyl diphosphate synthase [Streptomyces sp. DT2A-34]
MQLSSQTRATPAPCSNPPLRHLAVIPDGNRRWARDRGLSAAEGHWRGGERSMELLDWCRGEAEIEVVTMWAMSIENYEERLPAEVESGLPLLAEFTRQVAAGGRWRIGLVGDLDLLPSRLADELRDYRDQSSTVSGPLVNMAVAYSGGNEIARAVEKLLRSRQQNGGTLLADERVDAAALAGHLDTAGLPDLDLVVRTSGETRLSGFMPWQAMHAELYFTPVLWPDFDEDEFRKALEYYRGRQRRHGK